MLILPIKLVQHPQWKKKNPNKKNKKTKQTNQPQKCGALCVCLSLRGAGFAGFCVVPRRADGGDGHRQGWDGNMGEGGELGTHIQGVTRVQSLPSSRPSTDAGVWSDSPSLKQGLLL